MTSGATFCSFVWLGIHRNTLRGRFFQRPGSRAVRLLRAPSTGRLAQCAAHSGRDLNVDYSLKIDAPGVPQHYAAYGLVGLRILQPLYAATNLAVRPDHNLHYDRDRKACVHECMGICPSPVHAVSGHKTDTQYNAKCVQAALDHHSSFPRVEVQKFRAADSNIHAAECNQHNDYSNLQGYRIHDFNGFLTDCDVIG